MPGYEAPVYLAWSRRNRSALIRVPLYHPGKEGATRAELRCPDPACNPYLCFAGMLHAGLEGIEKGYELPEPMEQNLYHLTPEERQQRGIDQLPETLGEAIEIAAESELVLRILGEHTFKRFIEVKRQEWEDYRVQVTPWEIEQLPAGPCRPAWRSLRRSGCSAEPRRTRGLLADRRVAPHHVSRVVLRCGRDPARDRRSSRSAGRLGGALRPPPSGPGKFQLDAGRRA